MGFRLLLLNAIAGGANMGESGVKLDSSSVSAFMDHKHRLTNSMVAKGAREKRRKIIADRKAKRCTASESNVVPPITESMVSQIARERRRQIIAAKKAKRYSTSNAAFSNNFQSSQRTNTKQDKNSRLSDKKLQHETSEAPRQKPQIDDPPMNAEKKCLVDTFNRC